jgi:hypothetical protein
LYFQSKLQAFTIEITLAEKESDIDFVDEEDLGED